MLFFAGLHLWERIQVQAERGENVPYPARKMEARLFLSFIIAELYYVYCRVSFTGRGTSLWKRGTTSTPSWETWRHLEWRREDLFLGRSEHKSRNIELGV
jgi:hypothetical protein